MKIAIVCDIYGKENNGTAVVTYNLIRFLQEQGHNVRILCADQASKGKPNHYVVPNLNFGKRLNAYVAKVGVSLAKPDKRIICEALKGVDAVHIMVPLTLGLGVIIGVMETIYYRTRDVKWLATTKFWMTIF